MNKIQINAGDIVTIKPNPSVSLPNDGKPWEVTRAAHGVLTLRLVGGTDRDTCGASPSAVVTLNGETV